jgi:putative transposase
MTVRDVCAQHGVHEVTFYRWKRRFGDMGTSDVKRLRELESENARLKRMLSESALELDAIKDVLRGK